MVIIKFQVNWQVLFCATVEKPAFLPFQRNVNILKIQNWSSLFFCTLTYIPVICFRCVYFISGIRIGIPALQIQFNTFFCEIQFGRVYTPNFTPTKGYLDPLNELLQCFYNSNCWSDAKKYRAEWLKITVYHLLDLVTPILLVPFKILVLLMKFWTLGFKNDKQRLKIS